MKSVFMLICIVSVGCSNAAFQSSIGQVGPAGAPGSGFTPGVGCDVYTIPTSTYENSSGYFTVDWAAMFAAGSLEFSTVLNNFDVPNEPDTTLFEGFTTAQAALVGDTDFALDCEGYLNVPVTGGYVLTISSDDGAQLVIDDQVVVNMAKAQPYSSGSSSLLTLFSGNHKINVLYFQGPSTNQGLTLSWQYLGSTGLTAAVVVPSAALTH